MSHPMKKPVTILMADDDADDRQMTREAFEENHLANELRFVEDGEELLDYLHQRGKYADPAMAPWPSIILLDLNMPRMDGRDGASGVEERPAVPRDPGCHHDHFQGGGGRGAQLRFVRRLVYH